MKVLFITRHYLDEMLGGPNCSKAFVRAVANIFSDTTLIYPEHNDTKSNLSFLKVNENSHLNLIPMYDKRSKLKKLVDIYRGRLHRFSPFVKDYLRSNTFDIIFIDHSFTASSGVIEAARKNGAKIITFHHNVEKQYFKDNHPNILYRLPYLYYALRAERQAIKYSTINFTLTQDDQKTFSTIYPESATSFHTLGVFEYEDADTHQVSVEEGLKFIISGSMSAMQTETAVLDFLDNYMPILSEMYPQACLTITGRNPSEYIRTKASKFSNVTILANPEDLTSEVVKGNYYICPLATGGGLKLRCLDALRVGLPIIAQKLSTRGYESIVKEGYMLPYSTPKEFSEALKKITALHNVHTNVVKSYKASFSFKQGMKRLQNILKEEIK